MSGTAIKVPTEFRAVDKFTSVVKKMTAGVSRFSKSGISAIKRFDTQVDKTLNSMGKIQQLALGLGVGALFNAAIQNNIAYNDSLASVSSITGLTGDKLADLEKMSLKTAKSQKMLGSEVNKAYELVGSAQPALLKNTKLLDEVTNSAVNLSKAGRMDLEPAVNALTTTLNQFGLGGEKASDVFNNLAAGSVAGASNITDTSEAIKKFGTNAAAAGIKVNESIALIQLVSPFEKGAEAGTKLRNILSKMANANVLPPETLKMLKGTGVEIGIITDKTKPLKDRLIEMSKVAKDSDTMSKVFGIDSGLAQGLFNNAKGFEKMLASVNDTTIGMKQVSINSNTFKGALNAIKNSFLNATTATNSNNSSLNFLKDILFSVGNNMESIIAVAGTLIVAWGTMKGLAWGIEAAVFAQNIALGFNTMLTQKNKKAIIGNTIATNAYKVAMGISTAMTWLANTAFGTLAVSILAATWPILAIIAAITALVYVFLYWDEIVAFVKKSFLKSIMAISSAWGGLVKWFKEFSFEDFFKQIGQSIINFLLSPLKTVLWLVSKMPGKLGKIGADALASVNDVTGSILVSKKSEDKLPPNVANLRPEAERQEAISKILKRSAKLANPEGVISEEQKNKILDKKLDPPEVKKMQMMKENISDIGRKIEIIIKDKGGNVESATSNSPEFIINVTPNVGAY